MAAMKSLKLSYLSQYLRYRLDFFTKPYVFRIKEYSKIHENFIRLYYRAKFKMAAMKSLVLPYLPQYLRYRLDFFTKPYVFGGIKEYNETHQNFMAIIIIQNLTWSP